MITAGDEPVQTGSAVTGSAGTGSAQDRSPDPRVPAKRRQISGDDQNSGSQGQPRGDGDGERGGAQDRCGRALREIAYLLERSLEPTYRVRAFRTAAGVVDELTSADLSSRVNAGTLTELTGIGEVTGRVIREAYAGQVPEYLQRLRGELGGPLTTGGGVLRGLLRGDLHTHSDWSDGGSPIAEMARAARDLGHQYAALTDHSPRLTVANGLTRERLERQLEIVAEVNQQLAPFRLLTGIEVDILEDGSLDQDLDLLHRLDVVVASVHSKLRMPAAAMTPRMVAAVANPAVDILGHCTGRMVVGRGRPESEFDADLVFEACRRFEVAVEINSRPERLDPPRRLLALAAEAGCLFTVDTDAHAPGQLEWQVYGCERAEAVGVDPARVVNTWALADVLNWGQRRNPGSAG